MLLNEKISYAWHTCRVWFTFKSLKSSVHCLFWHRNSSISKPKFRIFQCKPIPIAPFWYKNRWYFFQITSTFKTLHIAFKNGSFVMPDLGFTLLHVIKFETDHFKDFALKSHRSDQKG